MNVESYFGVGGIGVVGVLSVVVSELDSTAFRAIISPPIQKQTGIPKMNVKFSNGCASPGVTIIDATIQKHINTGRTHLMFLRDHSTGSMPRIAANAPRLKKNKALVLNPGAQQRTPRQYAIPTTPRYTAPPLLISQ